jgi:hypothetical protein
MGCFGDVKLGDNPLYRDRGGRRELSSRERLVVNLVVAAVLVVLLVTGDYVPAAIFAVVWVIGQILGHRHRQ